MHGVVQFDSLTVGQTKHLVVVQHSVHILNPQRVHWPVTHDPLMILTRVLQSNGSASLSLPVLEFVSFVCLFVGGSVGGCVGGWVGCFACLLDCFRCFFLYNGILVPVRTSFGLRRRSGKT